VAVDPGCACRKLNPAILMMQSAQDWATKNVPVAIDGARDRWIFLQGQMRAGPIINKRLYKLRWRIESAFSRLKDFRRIATRYDKLARNYLASVCLAAALIWWT
jgi:Transposase DDE domain